MFLLRLINCKFHKILTTIMKMLFVFSNQRDARNQICSNFQNKHTNNIHLSFYAVAHTALKSILFYWMVKRANAMIMASEEKKHAIKTKFYIAMNKTFTRKLISPHSTIFLCVCAKRFCFVRDAFFLFSLPLFFIFCVHRLFSSVFISFLIVLLIK